MRTITKESVNALLTNTKLNKQNMRVEHGKMYLHDNQIAEMREDGLYITNAGWFSNTTKERLNGLPNVHIQQKKGVWYLNGKEWDGSVVKV